MSTFRRRTRASDGSNQSGTRSITGPFGSETITITSNMQDDYVEDHTSSHFSSFRCSNTKILGSIINGQFDDYWGHVTYSNVPSGLHNNLIDYKLGITPDDGYLKTATLAKTNPNIATMSIPNSLYELRELPGLVKQYAQEAFDIVCKNISLKNLAHLNLMASFGVAPMLSDYDTLMDFQKNVEKRLHNMQSIRRYGGVTKTKRLGQYTDAFIDPAFFNDGPVFIPYSITQKTQVSCKGSTRWVLREDAINSDLYSDHSGERDSLSEHLSNMIGLTGQQVTPDQLNAFRSAYGLYSYGINDLWNILPFSWLTDYFSNVGDVVDANANQLGLDPYKACLIKESTVLRQHPEVSGGGISISEGTLMATLKTREPIDIPSARSNITYKVPAIDGKQWGILGSLALSFFPRAKGASSSNPYLSWAHRVVAGVNNPLNFSKL